MKGQHGGPDGIVEEENRRMIEDERDLVMDDDDLDDSSDDDSDLDGFSPNCKDHIKLTKLNWRCLKPLAPSAWVFWSGVPNSVSQALEANEKFTDTIIFVIQYLMMGFDSYNFGVLIQLWAPRRDGDRCVLTIADQPFGLSKNVDQLYDFRKECMKYKFYVDAKSRSPDDSCVLGHVFQQTELAFTPDFRWYTNEEYPQRCNALESIVRTSMAFPIIEPSTGSCVGVLEVLCSIPVWYSLHIIQRVTHEIQGVGLRSSDFCSHAFHDVDIKTYNQVLQEISKGMKVVCETHKLLLGQTWFACRCCRDVELGGNCNSVGCKGQKMDSHYWNGGSYASTAIFRWFIISCFNKHLRKGHGVGGRALSSYSPCFCKDVTRYRKTEYSLVHLARMFCLTGCFAICLKSTYTGDADYVMEFFLPPNKNGGRIPMTLLYSILATMKEHFPSFKVASGKELGQELSIEVIKFFKDRRPGDSFKISQITRSEHTLALRDVGGTVQLDSTNQQLMVEADAINNERNVALDSTEQQLMVETDAINSEMNVGLEQSHNVIYSENNGFLRTSMEQKTEIENEITSDVLEKLFGMRLADAAKKLKVSRSTLKRICRKHGIKRWPRPKRTKRNGSLTKPKQPEQALENMGIENEGASHDLRNLCPPTAAEASQQGLDLELHLPGLSMAQGLDPHAVISTRPEASGRGVLTLSTVTTFVSGNLSPGMMVRLREFEQTFQGAADGQPANLPSDGHFPAVQVQPETPLGEMPIENVVGSRTAESRCPSAQDAWVEETAESSTTNFPCPGTTSHVLEAILTIKVTYGTDVARISLSSTSGIMELKIKVAERLKLNSDTFNMKYEDDDKDLILMTCDADLQEFLGSSDNRVIRLC